MTKGSQLQERRDARAEVRCGCGSLLARLVDEGVELKCRRCQRRVVLRPEVLRRGVTVELHDR